MENIRAKSVDTCASDCLDCHRACLVAVEHCIETGGDLVKPDLLRKVRVCAEFCRTTAFVLETRSDFLTHTCSICAAICDACAEACMEIKDELLERCAKACKDCSDSCLAMTTSKAA